MLLYVIPVIGVPMYFVYDVFTSLGTTGRLYYSKKPDDVVNELGILLRILCYF